MTLKKQICSLLALILMPILSYAYDFESDGIYYNINPDGETVSVTYREEVESSYSGNVVIPSKVTYDGKTYTVTEIGERAFESSRLSSIYIPNSVTDINLWAFLNCYELKTVCFGNSVTIICMEAFAYCRTLESVTITGSVNIIDDRAFIECSSLASVTIGNSDSLIIGDEAFLNCDLIKSVYCYSASAPSIRDSTFSQNTYNNAVLIVYENNKDEFLYNPIWDNFTNILLIPGGAVEEPVCLSVLFPDRGEVAVEVPYNKTTTVKVFPDNVDGYRLSSVTFNGEDILDSLDADHRYTTPKLTADAVISVVYVSDKASVGQTAADSIKVSASSGTVRIMGAAPESEATVCDMSGNIVRKTAEKTFTLDKGIYILTVEGISFKFAL